MTPLGRTGACLAVLVAAAIESAGASQGGRAARTIDRPALTGVELLPPPGGDTLASVTPTFIVRAVGVAPEDRPIQLHLQVALTPGFASPLVVDTTVVGDSASVTVQHPLPAGVKVYVRAIARSLTSEAVMSPAIERVVPEWLTLVSPNEPNGVTLETPRPRFVWRSPSIEGPAAPWIYDLEIRNVGSGRSIFYANLTDTTVTLRAPLELNTSYRWSVTARHGGGQFVTVVSRSSFVIINPMVPLVTLLYQNFPNPFPTATSTSTCVWFDLHVAAHVRLDVFDLRGRHVRNIIPGQAGMSEYQAGRHGRVAGGQPQSGCNGDIQWDGRGTDGELVSAGVYLLRLQAAGVESVKKIVFRGRP